MRQVRGQGEAGELIVAEVKRGQIRQARKREAGKLIAGKVESCHERSGSSYSKVSKTKAANIQLGQARQANGQVQAPERIAAEVKRGQTPQALRQGEVGELIV